MYGGLRSYSGLPRSPWTDSASYGNGRTISKDTSKGVEQNPRGELEDLVFRRKHTMGLILMVKRTPGSLP